MYDFFEEKVDWMDSELAKNDNGERDTKADYTETKLNIIESTIDELEEMKAKLKKR